MTDTSPSQPGIQEDELDLMRLLGLVWRGRWIILACVAVAIVLSMLYVRNIAVPKYASTARLVIEAEDRNVVDIEAVVSGISTSDTSINTELSIITSRGMIEKLIRDLELYKDPEFNGALYEPNPYSIAGIRKRVLALFGQEDAAGPEQSIEQAVLSTIPRTTRAIRAVSVQKTLLIDITVTTEDPRKSTQMANRLAAIYVQSQVETKFDAVEYAINWLTERVTELEGELRTRQNELDNVRSEAALVGIETLEAMTVRSVELRSRQSNLTNTITEKTELIERARVLIEAGDGDGLVALFDDRILNEIAGTVDDGTLMENERFNARIDTLVDQETSSIQRLTSQRDVFRDSLNRLNEEISQQTTALKRVEELTRDLQAVQTLYETFLSRLKETSLQIGLQQADSRVLSEAPPFGRQVAPQVRRTVSLAIVFAFLVGVGIILVVQFTQRGIRSAGELESLSGQNVMGQIPLSPVKDRKKLLEYLRNKPTSAMSEAVRNLRTSVTLTNPKNPPNVIMITSSVPGEGKTTVAASLALNLASLGKKVLLIDGDIRRNTLSDYFKGVDTENKPGIVSLLDGDVSLQEAVLTLPDTGIDVLMSEKSVQNAADIFASEPFSNFMKTLREHYDHVIIDTPPVLAVPDARVIARFADAVLYIVGWNKTHREQVREGISELRSLGVTISGVVLNQIDGRKMSRYGYGYGGYSRYGSRKYGQGYYDN
ncbi:polysaccharide biosynthesis tyrosine autokinase [uncultured Maritimibacter sp.]|uniref:polysaccharide biosynthesis tyrosine autokinase n=1 Tax=uncultured Maritimibacter sp. TaxID=991866 RepID=UPI002596ED90|nr:polysaccharide biosynthesis tyrosine autokinase [uncultured Maritimibacter sp.]